MFFFVLLASMPTLAINGLGSYVQHYFQHEEKARNVIKTRKRFRDEIKAVWRIGLLEFNMWSHTVSPSSLLNLTMALNCMMAITVFISMLIGVIMYL